MAKKPKIQHGMILCPECATVLASVESVELGGCEVKRCWFCGQEINLNKLKGEKENEKD